MASTSWSGLKDRRDSVAVESGRDQLAVVIAHARFGVPDAPRVCKTARRAGAGPLRRCPCRRSARSPCRRLPPSANSVGPTPFEAGHHQPDQVGVPISVEASGGCSGRRASLGIFAPSTTSASSRSVSQRSTPYWNAWARPSSSTNRRLMGYPSASRPPAV
jgi:hypothetical protein